MEDSNGRRWGQEPGRIPTRHQTPWGSNHAPNIRFQGILSQGIYLKAQANLADSKPDVNPKAGVFCVSIFHLAAGEDWHHVQTSLDLELETEIAEIEIRTLSPYGRKAYSAPSIGPFTKLILSTRCWREKSPKLEKGWFKNWNIFLIKAPLKNF